MILYSHETLFLSPGKPPENYEPGGEFLFFLVIGSKEPRNKAAP